MKSKVKKAMTEKGVTLRKLRELTSKTDNPDRPQALSMATIMNARDDDRILSCSLGTLERIARALGCSVHELFEDDPGRETDGGR